MVPDCGVEVVLIWSIRNVQRSTVGDVGTLSFWFIRSPATVGDESLCLYFDESPIVEPVDAKRHEQRERLVILRLCRPWIGRRGSIEIITTICACA